MLVDTISMEKRQLLLDKATIRKYLVYYQGLLKPRFFKASDIVKFIQQVGCIQYDPLRPLARNADLVLQARIPQYQEEMLDKLLYQDRIILDGWDKMQSLYLTTDWPYLSRIRQSYIENYMLQLSDQKKQDILFLAQKILEHLQQHGPSFLREMVLPFEHPNKNKLAHNALDYLCYTGKIGVFNKKRGIRQYDCIENIIPQAILQKGDPFKAEDDFLDWYVLRKISSIGIYWAKSSSIWYTTPTKMKADRQKVISRLIDQKKLTSVVIEDCKDTFYLPTTHLPLLQESKTVSYEKQVHFIAPLDNLIWDRMFIQTIFNFDYMWEVYKPLSARKYGYYVLPVLYGTLFVARFEGTYQPTSKTLTIQNWWWEKGTVVDIPLLHQIKIALLNFQQFLQAEQIQLQSVQKILPIDFDENESSQ